MTTYPEIEKAYKSVLRVFQGEIGYREGLEAAQQLCKVLKETETDESVWSIGEFEIADLSTLIIGTYCFLSDYHGGQASFEYEMLCIIGSIYSPGLSDGPEEDSSEEVVYQEWERIWKIWDQSGRK